MNCNDAAKFMEAYLDGELDPITSQTIEQHLRNCPESAEAYEAHAVVTGALGRATPYYKAAPELRQRIHFSLQDEIGNKSTRHATRGSQWLTSTRRSEQRSVLSEMPWNWLALAAAVILAAILASTLSPWLRRSNADRFLATQLIASHVRSLMASHLTDVASSDQHTVKPWLDAKLDFAPKVVDLGSDGFPLLGGRLDYLENRPVAALVYQKGKHFINLFVWPLEPGATATPGSITRQGYQLLHWTDPDFNYWVVSDVNMDDLRTFQQLFEKRIPRR